MVENAKLVPDCTWFFTERHRSLRGPVHQKFADVLMSCQVLRNSRVAMNQGTFGGNLWSKTPSRDTLHHGSSLASLLPSCSNLRKVSRRW